MALSASSRGSSSWFSFYPPCELGHDPSPVLECCWLAAAGDSDDAELDEIGRELEADLNFRDRMDTEANQLEEQGEFRAAELLRLRADALQDQITVKLENVRASRPGKYSWEEDRWEEDSC